MPPKKDDDSNVILLELDDGDSASVVSDLNLDDSEIEILEVKTAKKFTSKLSIISESSKATQKRIRASSIDSGPFPSGSKVTERTKRQKSRASDEKNGTAVGRLKNVSSPSRLSTQSQSGSHGESNTSQSRTHSRSWSSQTKSLNTVTSSSRLSTEDSWDSDSVDADSESEVSQSANEKSKSLRRSGRLSAVRDCRTQIVTPLRKIVRKRVTGSRSHSDESKGDVLERTARKAFVRRDTAQAQTIKQVCRYASAVKKYGSDERVTTRSSASKKNDFSSQEENKRESSVELEYSDSDSVYEVEDIVQYNRWRGQHKLKVKWVGWAKSTWEPLENFFNQRDMIRKLLKGTGKKLVVDYKNKTLDIVTQYIEDPPGQETVEIRQLIRLPNSKFGCPYCPAQVASRDSPHLLCHVKKSPFKCPKCNYCGQSEGATKLHRTLVHGRPKNSDSNNNVELADDESEVQDDDAAEKNHSDNKVFECDKCLAKYTGKQAFNTHLEGHEKVTDYQCCICGFYASKSFTLTRHLNHHHAVEDGPETRSCHSVQFESDSHSADDEEDGNGANAMRTKNDTRSCQIMDNESDAELVGEANKGTSKCARKTACYLTGRDEDASHVSGKSSDESDNRTEDEPELVMDNKSGDIRCPHCAQLFNRRRFSSNEYKRHVRSHSDDGKFKCEQCTFSSDNRAAVVRHDKMVHGIVPASQSDVSNRSYSKVHEEHIAEMFDAEIPVDDDDLNCATDVGKSPKSFFELQEATNSKEDGLLEETGQRKNTVIEETEEEKVVASRPPTESKREHDLSECLKLRIVFNNMKSYKISPSGLSESEGSSDEDCDSDESADEMGAEDSYEIKSHVDAALHERQELDINFIHWNFNVFLRSQYQEGLNRTEESFTRRMTFAECVRLCPEALIAYFSAIQEGLQKRYDGIATLVEEKRQNRLEMFKIIELQVKICRDQKGFELLQKIIRDELDPENMEALELFRQLETRINLQE